MSRKVFLDYDQAALDAQYDNRAKVPAFPQYLERYRAASLAARKRFAANAQLDVPVGLSPIERPGCWPTPPASAPTRSGSALPGIRLAGT